ncbi:MAG: hypothetical protein HN348_18095, partial [Proteobacteria bacterium]|nr:hypothetical protein [Pseudomonadota bacterium]
MRCFKLLGPLLALMLAPGAMAGGLGEYKEQKHTDREKVTKKTCEEEYIERCQADCKAGDDDCKSECKQEAPGFCKQRQKRKARKTVEIVGKGASVGAGAAAVVAQNAIIARKRKKAAEDGTLSVATEEGEPDPYAIRFLAPSALVEVGGGYLTAKAGLGTINLAARWGFVGVSGQSTYMADSEDWIFEGDYGPTVYIASPNIMFGLQPSLLLSATNLDESEITDGKAKDFLVGGGARSYTTVHLR